MKETSEGFDDQCRIVDGSQLATGPPHATLFDNTWWPLHHANLETRGAPINQTNNRAFLEDFNTIRDLLYGHVTAVQQCTGHHHRMSWIAHIHLILLLETFQRQLWHGECYNTKKIRLSISIKASLKGNLLQSLLNTFMCHYISRTKWSYPKLEVPKAGKWHEVSL